MNMYIKQKTCIITCTFVAVDILTTHHHSLFEGLRIVGVLYCANFKVP